MTIPIHGRQNHITSRRIIFVTILVLVCSNFLELYGTVLFCFWCTEMCGVQLNDRKRSKDMMWMLGLIVTTEQCSLAWSWVVGKSWSCQEKGIRLCGWWSKKGNLKRIWKIRLSKKVWRLAWEGLMQFADQSGVLALNELLLGGGEFGNPHLMGTI